MSFKIKKEFKEFKSLMRCVPAYIPAIFAAALFSMNLLANKSINLPVDWLALDCGIIVSWLVFLCMDILSKHFGPKAATEISVFALLINLLLCLMFYLASLIPGVWSQSYVDGSEGVINSALNYTFGGVWYIILGSALAFIVSAVINNFTNFFVGKLFKNKPDGAAAYFMRSYVSTAVAQFADNLVFAFVVSRVFFGWSALACVTCAVTGMIVELLCEATFSYAGFCICKRWKSEGVGEEYFKLKNGEEEE